MKKFFCLLDQADSVKECSKWNLLSVLSFVKRNRTVKNSLSCSKKRPNDCRKPAFETLEDRYLLSAVPGSAGLDLPAAAGKEIVVTTLENDPSDTEISLQEAIDQAVSGDTITFAESLSGQTITLTEELVIDEAISIDASELAEGITVNANETGRVFTVSSGTGDAPVQLINLTITGGCTNSDNGGGIYNTGYLILTSCVVSDNSASCGGGIYNADLGTITINNNTSISNNTASFGCGIANFGTLNCIESSISENTASNTTALGGGIYNKALMTLTDCQITGNSAGSGGGIYNEAQGTVTGCCISENSALLGAGIHTLSSYSYLSITNSLIIKNKPLSVEDFSFLMGGGIYQNEGNLIITNCTITENQVDSLSGSCGGLFILDSDRFSLYNTIIVNNAKSDITIGDTVTIDGYNNLSSYTDWDTGTSGNNLVYQAGEALFADGGYALLKDSRAVDSGDNEKAEDLTVDYAGNMRISNEKIDIGAYEYQFPWTPLEEISLSSYEPVYSSDGESTTISVNLPEGVSGEITYEWYRVVEGGEEQNLDVTESSYTVKFEDLKWSLKVYVTQQYGNITNQVSAETGKVLPAVPTVSFKSTPEQVQTNCTVYFDTELGNSHYYDADEITYYWQVADQGFKEGNADFWFTAENLNLMSDEQNIAIQMYVVDEYGHKSDTQTATVKVISSKPVLCVQTAEFDNGQILKLVMNLRSAYWMDVNQWIVNWGDHSEQAFDTVSEALTAAHYYAQSNEVKNYQVSVTVKNSSQGEIYSGILFTYKLDALLPSTSGLLNESANAADTVSMIFDPAANKAKENQEIFFVPVRAAAAAAESELLHKAVLFAVENPNEEESVWDFLNDETLSSYTDNSEEVPLLDEDEIAVLL